MKKTLYSDTLYGRCGLLNYFDKIGWIINTICINYGYVPFTDVDILYISQNNKKLFSALWGKSKDTLNKIQKIFFTIVAYGSKDLTKIAVKFQEYNYKIRKN